MLVRCVSLETWLGMTPEPGAAVLGVLGMGSERPSTDQWGPATLLRIRDVDYDVSKVVSPEGWAEAKERGLFTKDHAGQVRRFVTCDVVRQSESLVVFGQEGLNAAMAVALYASNRLGWKLEIEKDSRVNEAVHTLLNPRPAREKSDSTGNASVWSFIGRQMQKWIWRSVTARGSG